MTQTSTSRHFFLNSNDHSYFAEVGVGVFVEVAVRVVQQHMNRAL